MKFFTRAILRKPGRSIVDGLAQDPNHQKPDYIKALKEHNLYADALRSMGLNLTICEADENFPDGNFVEDTHLILGDKMIIELNPGAETRKDEVTSLAPFLPTNISKYVLSKNHTIDGGDILKDGDKIYVGLSKRTQQAAVDELRFVVSPLGYQVEAYPVPEGLHLKSGMTRIAHKHYVIQASFEGIVKDIQSRDSDVKYFIVPEAENFAANVLPINGKIMIPTGCPETKKYISQFYQPENILEVDTSETRLIDGALTCSSLLLR